MLTEAALGGHDVTRVAQLHGDEPVTVHLLVPADTGHNALIEALDEAALGRLPGAVSRWNAKKDLSWVPLRPDLVVEVAYDHMEGTRFRHTAQWRRWRPDRTPQSCTYDQLDRPVRFDLAEILSV